MREYTSKPAPPAESALAGVGFTLDGQRFACEGHLSVLEISELAAAAAEGADTSTPEGVGLIANFLKLAFGPAEYTRFRRHCRDHRTSDETLIEIVSGIQEEVMGAVEAQTGRPTASQPASSAGLPQTGDRMSRIVSLQTGDVTVVPMPEPQDRKPKRTTPAPRKPRAKTG